MNYKAVLFDMDGVITDSEPLHFAATKAAVKSYGHDLSAQQYKQHFFGVADKLGFKRYFDSLSETVELPSIIDTKVKAYLELADGELTLYPGVTELIQDLTRHNISLAVVTGQSRAEAQMALKAFGLADFFKTIITAEDVSQSKPSPEGYLKGAAALGFEAADCIVIEDAPSGIKAANAAGMRCLAVTTTHTEEELEGATSIIDQLGPGCIVSLGS